MVKVSTTTFSNLPVDTSETTSNNNVKSLDDSKTVATHKTISTIDTNETPASALSYATAKSNATTTTRISNDNSKRMNQEAQKIKDRLAKLKASLSVSGDDLPYVVTKRQIKRNLPKSPTNISTKGSGSMFVAGASNPTSPTSFSSYNTRKVKNYLTTDIADTVPTTLAKQLDTMKLPPPPTMISIEMNKTSQKNEGERAEKSSSPSVVKDEERVETDGESRDVNEKKDESEERSDVPEDSEDDNNDAEEEPAASVVVDLADKEEDSQDDDQIIETKRTLGSEAGEEINIEDFERLVAKDVEFEKEKMAEERLTDNQLAAKIKADALAAEAILQQQQQQQREEEEARNKIDVAKEDEELKGQELQQHKDGDEEEIVAAEENMNQTETDQEKQLEEAEKQKQKEAEEAEGALQAEKVAEEMDRHIEQLEKKEKQAKYERECLEAKKKEEEEARETSAEEEPMVTATDPSLVVGQTDDVFSSLFNMMGGDDDMAAMFAEQIRQEEEARLAEEAKLDEEEMYCNDANNIMAVEDKIRFEEEARLAEEEAYDDNNNDVGVSENTAVVTAEHQEPAQTETKKVVDNSIDNKKSKEGNVSKTTDIEADNDDSGVADIATPPTREKVFSFYDPAAVLVEAEHEDTHDNLGTIVTAEKQLADAIAEVEQNLQAEEKEKEALSSTEEDVPQEIINEAQKQKAEVEGKILVEEIKVKEDTTNQVEMPVQEIQIREVQEDTTEELKIDDVEDEKERISRMAAAAYAEHLERQQAKENERIAENIKEEVRRKEKEIYTFFESQGALSEYTDLLKQADEVKSQLEDSLHLDDNKDVSNPEEETVPEEEKASPSPDLVTNQEEEEVPPISCAASSGAKDDSVSPKEPEIDTQDKTEFSLADKDPTPAEKTTDTGDITATSKDPATAEVPFDCKMTENNVPREEQAKEEAMSDAAQDAEQIPTLPTINTELPTVSSTVGSPTGTKSLPGVEMVPTDELHSLVASPAKSTISLKETQPPTVEENLIEDEEQTGADKTALVEAPRNDETYATIEDLMCDPDIAIGMQNPKVVTAFVSFMGNPKDFLSDTVRMEEMYSDPDIEPVLRKVIAKMKLTNKLDAASSNSDRLNDTIKGSNDASDGIFESTIEEAKVAHTAVSPISVPDLDTMPSDEMELPFDELEEEIVTTTEHDQIIIDARTDQEGEAIKIVEEEKASDDANGEAKITHDNTISEENSSEEKNEKSIEQETKRNTFQEVNQPADEIEGVSPLVSAAELLSEVTEQNDRPNVFSFYQTETDITSAVNEIVEKHDDVDKYATGTPDEDDMEEAVQLEPITETNDKKTELQAQAINAELKPLQDTDDDSEPDRYESVSQDSATDDSDSVDKTGSSSSASASADDEDERNKLGPVGATIAATVPSRRGDSARNDPVFNYISTSSVPVVVVSPRSPKARRQEEKAQEDSSCRVCVIQ